MNKNFFYLCMSDHGITGKMELKFFFSYYSLFMMVTEDQEDLIKGLVLLLVLDVLIL